MPCWKPSVTNIGCVSIFGCSGRIRRKYWNRQPDGRFAGARVRVRGVAPAEPHLFSLLEELQGRDISLNGARDAVFRHVALIAGADPADPAFGERLFQLVSDPDFRRGLDAFHAWVQDLANGETRMREENEEGAPSFAAWEAAFRTWEAEKAVRHVTSISSFANKESA